MAVISCILCNRSVPSTTRDATIQKIIAQFNETRYYPTLFRLLRSEPVCESCLLKIEAIGEAICAHCGRKQSVGDVLCGDCQRLSYPALTFNRSVLPYNEWGKNIMALYKYRGEMRLAGLLSVIMLCGFYQFYTRADIGVLTWVPLHTNRLEDRGFNQVELIARKLEKYSGLLSAPLLTREKETQKQSKQTGRQARLLSMQNAFDVQVFVDSPANHKKSMEAVLILDDIYTTGSTIEACAQQLRNLTEYKEVPIYSLTLFR